MNYEMKVWRLRCRCTRKRDAFGMLKFDSVSEFEMAATGNTVVRSNSELPRITRRSSHIYVELSYFTPISRF